MIFYNIIWENIGSLRYAGLPNVDTFRYKIYKNHIVSFIRKDFKYWKFTSCRQKNSIFIWKLDFIAGNKHCPLFSMKWKAHIVYFQELVCQIPIWITIDYQSFFYVFIYIKVCVYINIFYLKVYMFLNIYKSFICKYKPCWISKNDVP